MVRLVGAVDSLEAKNGVVWAPGNVSGAFGLRSVFGVGVGGGSRGRASMSVHVARDATATTRQACLWRCRQVRCAASLLDDAQALEFETTAVLFRLPCREWRTDIALTTCQLALTFLALFAVASGAILIFVAFGVEVDKPAALPVGRWASVVAFGMVVRPISGACNP